ncbi:MAG TPA: hypothetical protein VGX25_30265 [Actinophytocola sp.]|uniref:hypothetical protein n=1 Tax=Actinophytocola sp. TaxID=1872138 RepID=UPI002DDD5868|nr:hypothetical protein [Actinophytocola sp.]HEV2783693.1 hypothetical protein [Actinophytocola sp.]
MAAVICTAFVALTSTAFPAAADTEDDALLVYCLSGEQRAALTDAAVALGLAETDSGGAFLAFSGGQTEPLEWHRNRPDDFNRTCAALSEAQRPMPDRTLPTLVPFLTGVVGALLAFAAASVRDRVTRGRTLADELRAAFRGFEHAARTYLDSWTPTRPQERVLELAEHRVALQNQLARTKAAHRRWTTVDALETEVLTGELGQAMTLDWKGKDEDRERRDRLRERLAAARDTVFRVARALEQPLWPHPSQRGGRQ